jgi:hypothetical protein
LNTVKIQTMATIAAVGAARGFPRAGLTVGALVARLACKMYYSHLGKVDAVG